MKNTPLPPLTAVLKLTGRIWSRDMGPMLGALDKAQRAPRGAAELPAVRVLRRECIKWIVPERARKRPTPHDERNFVLANDLLRRAHKRYNDLIEENVLPASLMLPVPPIPPLPTVTTASGTFPRIGNTMRDKYVMEMASPHWTPKVNENVDETYMRYRARNGRLNRTDFARLVLAPSLEDDPERQILADGELKEQPGSGYSTPSDRVTAQALTEGIRYLNEKERVPYQVRIRGGVLYDTDSVNRLDTKNKQVGDYGHGWGMFVLGFDNVLYVEGEARDYFHHSSFFAGGAVQCAGEICCIDGAVRFLTAKAGHYRSELREFRQVLEFLRRNGVDLGGVLVATHPKDRPYKWYSAVEVLAREDVSLPAPRKIGLPAKLERPGTPEIKAE